ncbi:hypothetical protein RLEG12_33155 [Rhizobium leguminosarum bv. trifolii CB782]|nr:hypothetical protein RLEG12_33155 [Rhizobium leguminosarum bv. trifolii CB782]
MSNGILLFRQRVHIKAIKKGRLGDPFHEFGLKLAWTV